MLKDPGAQGQQWRAAEDDGKLVTNCLGAEMLTEAT